MSDPIIEAHNLTKVFYPPLSFSNVLALNHARISPTKALQEVSFSVGRNDILAILGPNGAGKTTLLKIIASLIIPDQGTLTVNGETFDRCEEKIKSSIGLVIDEERSFYWRLTGRQNLDFFAALYGFDKTRRSARIRELCDIFEVDYADKRFDGYSTGMKKRFALMRALLHDPHVLLLDEPAKSLDFPAAAHLRDFVTQRLSKELGKTIILTTHRMEEAMDFAGTFMVMDKGRVRGKGTLEELRKKTDSPQASLGEVFLSLLHTPS